MNFRLSIALGIQILCSLSLFSQEIPEPAFIVTNRNDTLYGAGTMSINQDYCTFRKIDGNQFSFYNPDEIWVFRFIDGKYYVAQQVKEPDGQLKWYFLEYLVDGEIDLYAIPATYRYFIKKEHEEFIELNDHITNLKEIDGASYLVQDKKYLGYIRAYMADAPQLFSEIDKMRHLNQRDLVRLSVDYHNAVCNEYECVNYTKKILHVRTKVEFATGVTRHNNYFSPKGAVLFHLPLKDDRIYLKTGLLYGEKPYWQKDHDDKYDYNFKFPVSFQFVFTSTRFKPTLALGWPTGIFLLSSAEAGFIYSVTPDWEVSMNGSIDGLLSLALYQYTEGYSLGFGIIYNLKGK